MKKLYELPRNTYFYNADPTDGNLYLLHNIDGMFSYCVDVTTKEVVHWAAYMDVIVAEFQDQPSV